MAIVIVQIFQRFTPRHHLARAKILVDGKHLTTVDTYDCESVNEVEMKMKAAIEMARTLAKGLGCEVRDETYNLTETEHLVSVS